MGKTRRYAFLKDEKESYKHGAAKHILASWLKDDYDVSVEAEFVTGEWKFISDVAVFTEGHLQAFYEVEHKHPIDGHKLMKMQQYCYENNLEIFCHEVSADWILSQVDKPDRIVKFSYELTPSF